MEWFTVKYRQPNGAITEAEFEAADRSALFKMLSGRNITPVRVVDGRLAKNKGAKSGNVGRGILAGLIVVIGALAALYFLIPPDSGDKPAQSAKKQERKPNAYSTVKPAKSSGATLKQVNPPAAPGKDVDVASHETSPGAAAATADGSPSPEEEKPKPRRIFKHGTDQLIWLAVFASNGASIPPLPHMSKADTDRFIESLGTPIEIDPEEPEHIQQMKKAVDEVRREVAELLAKNPGEELMTVLNNHRDEFNGRLNLHADAQKEYNRFLEEGDAEGAEEYRQQANELLVQYGADPIEAESDEDGSDEPQN